MEVNLITIVYILCSILLIALIVLTIKLIFSVEKINKLLDDVQDKVSSFDSLFTVLDKTTDLLSGVSDRIVDSISDLFRKFLTKKKKEKEEKDE